MVFSKWKQSFVKVFFQKILWKNIEDTPLKYTCCGDVPESLQDVHDAKSGVKHPVNFQSKKSCVYMS